LHTTTGSKSYEWHKDEGIIVVWTVDVGKKQVVDAWQKSKDPPMHAVVGSIPPQPDPT